MIGGIDRLARGHVGDLLGAPALLAKAGEHLGDVFAHHLDGLDGTMGGTPPLKFNWSNGDTTSSISNLIPGVYSVEVYDQAGDTFRFSCLYVEKTQARDERIYQLLREAMDDGAVDTDLTPEQLLLLVWGQCAGALRVSVRGRCGSSRSTCVYESGPSGIPSTIDVQVAPQSEVFHRSGRKSPI